MLLENQSTFKAFFMKKFTWDRAIFYVGLHLLKLLLFIVALVVLINFIMSEYLEIIFSPEISLLVGMFLAIAIVAYELISYFTSKLISKIHYGLDQKEAIEIFEKYKLDVGFIFTDIPKDENNKYLKDCIEAYATLNNQKLPFVLINSDNESTARLYFLGKRGKCDNNKYKLIIERTLE